jgi:two-component system, response regulator
MPENQVLLVEDDPEDVELTKLALQKLLPGWTWIVARDGVEALDHLSNGNAPPTLVILDLNMPRMDGFELLERLASRWGPALRGLKIVILSASSESKDRQRAEKLGVKIYIRKPINAAEKKAMVDAIVAFVNEPS